MAVSSPSERASSRPLSPSASRNNLKLEIPVSAVTSTANSKLSSPMSKPLPRAPSFVTLLPLVMLGTLTFIFMVVHGPGKPTMLGDHAKPHDSKKPIFVVASHHKSGTGFAFSIIAQLSRYKALRSSADFKFGLVGPVDLPIHPSELAIFFTNERAEMPNLKWIETATQSPMRSLLESGDHRFIHLVRDPAEMVVSAYLYHLQEPEEEMWWLTLPGLVEISEEVAEALARSPCPHAGDPSWLWTWLDVMRCLPASEGIVAEGWKLVKHDIEPMANLCREVDCVKGSHASIQLDIDAVGRDFNSSLTRLMDFVGVEEREQPQLLAALEKRQHLEKSTGSKHVTTGKYDKRQLRKFLLRDFDLNRRLDELRSDKMCHSRATGNGVRRLKGNSGR